MAAKLTRMSQIIAIQLHLAAKSCTICSSRSRRQVLKLLDTPSYGELCQNILGEFYFIPRCTMSSCCFNKCLCVFLIRTIFARFKILATKFVALNIRYFHVMHLLFVRHLLSMPWTSTTNTHTHTYTPVTRGARCSSPLYIIREYNAYETQGGAAVKFDPQLRTLYKMVYPKVSGLAAWSENCKWYGSLPLGAVVSLFCESL
jgi:hypothetical protein